jgi:antitoxin component YwqK of YwqJK toxin-antitoxin module
MIYRKLLALLFCLIIFSCTDISNAVDFSELDIVRTSRDSSYFKNGTLFTGFVKKYVDDKELLSFSVKDGKIDGQYIEYYSSGSVKSLSNFKNGILYGKYSKFYDNNLLMEEYHYKNGFMEGERILNWRNGNLKEKNFFKRGAMIGASEFYFSNGNLRKVISFDVNGRRDGEWIDYNSDGKLKLKVVYKSGLVIDSIIYQKQ